LILLNGKITAKIKAGKDEKGLVFKAKP